MNDGSGPGPDSNSQIDDFIENQYKTCKVRPSYILLLGDAEFVPTFYVPTAGSLTTGSDYRYAIYPQFILDLLPDFALGRIPVDTLVQADTVVDKIISYEKSPPLDLSFYNSAAFASQFQCCQKDELGNPLSGMPGTDQRTFAEVSEFARNMLLGQGYNVDRIYTKTVDGGNSAATPKPIPAYLGDSTPRRWFDTTSLPTDLAPGSGFAWNGETGDVTDAINDGRFLVLHRDHGWPHGWGDPYFDSSHVDSLTNGSLQPVVYSVNCASGLFDNETASGDYKTTNDDVYFAERLLRKADGGAIGILGDTRNSPSWPNTALTKGFFDATWPGTVTDFGGGEKQKRLGDILNHGKLYMLGQITVPAAGVDSFAAFDELYLWHVIGDPTLEMRIKSPFTLTKAYTIENVGNNINISYSENGSNLTVYQNTQAGIVPLGRGDVVNGQSVINIFNPINPQYPIEVSASKEDGISQLLTGQVNNLD